MCPFAFKVTEWQSHRHSVFQSEFENNLPTWLLSPRALRKKYLNTALDKRIVNDSSGNVQRRPTAVVHRPPVAAARRRRTALCAGRGEVSRNQRPSGERPFSYSIPCYYYYNYDCGVLTKIVYVRVPTEVPLTSVDDWTSPRTLITVVVCAHSPLPVAHGRRPGTEIKSEIFLAFQPASAHARALDTRGGRVFGPSGKTAKNTIYK